MPIISISSFQEGVLVWSVYIKNMKKNVLEVMSIANLLGTTDVWLKPILTTIPQVRLAANKAKTAYT